MSDTQAERESRPVYALALLIVPLAVLWLLAAFPELDKAWEHHPAHFWLTMLAGFLAMTLGYSLSLAARRRRDARLYLISLGFISTAGFLGLHAMATPGVLVETNAGFEAATPVGLLLGGVFIAWSAQGLDDRASERVLARATLLSVGLAGVMALWAVFSLAGIPPLDEPLTPEDVDLFQTAIGGAGLILYALAAWGYLQLYRARGARLLFALTFAFALLAEAMVVVAFSLNWQISWWEWHFLMLASFVLMALAARAEWYEERFATVYTARTLLSEREVSILFADLRGYTSFSESHPLEEVVTMLNAYFERIVPTMIDMGGEVHQIIGDAIMVTFNQYGDTPDHAVLAARASLALQREGDEVAGHGKEWPRFRAGVNSGRVITGVVGGERGHRKHAVVGDPVNLAARLQSTAEIGEVVIGEATYAQLPEGTSVEEMEPLQLKGKARPVRAYRLLSLPPSEQ